jgi:hypothetical protein
MPAPGVTKNNQEISDCSSHREATISPSMSTPLPLRHVLLPNAFLKKGGQHRSFNPLPSMTSAEMVSILQSALDIAVPSDYWSDDDGTE